MVRSVAISERPVAVTLTPSGPAVHILRALELSPRGAVRLAMPFVVAMFRVAGSHASPVVHAKEVAAVIEEAALGE